MGDFLDLEVFDPSSLPGEGTVLLVGASGKGKSYLMRDLLYHNRNKYRWTKVISGTGGSTRNGLSGIVPDIFVQQDIDAPRLKSLMSQLTQLSVWTEANEGKFFHDPKLLLVLDDIMDQTVGKGTAENQQQLLQIATAGRHAKTNMFILTQDAMAVPKKAREQATHIFIVGMPTTGSIKSIMEVLPCTVKRAQFENLVARCVADFGALVIDRTVSEADKQIKRYKACFPPHEGFVVGSESSKKFHETCYDFAKASAAPAFLQSALPPPDRAPTAP